MQWYPFKRRHDIESDAYSFLAPGVSMVGNVQASGTIRIEGHLQGEVRMDGTLILGTEATVVGNVHAEQIVVGGRIEGDVKADKMVHLLKSAVLLGRLHSPALSVEVGARFQGDCQMGMVSMAPMVMEQPTLLEAFQGLQSVPQN